MDPYYVKGGGPLVRVLKNTTGNAKKRQQRNSLENKGAGFQYGYRQPALLASTNPEDRIGSEMAHPWATGIKKLQSIKSLIIFPGDDEGLRL